MTSSQHTALKRLRNLRLTQNEYVKKFPVIVLIRHLRNNTCYYSAGKHKPFTPQFPVLSPFGVPMAIHPHPGGSGAWTVRQSTQRQGSLKSNFTSKVQLHYEKINDLKGRLRLWLAEKVWMILIIVITSACSVSFYSNLNKPFPVKKQQKNISPSLHVSYNISLCLA